jgi:plastocyanin
VLRRLVGSVVVGTLALVSLATAAGGATTTVSVDDNFFKPKRLAVEVGDRVVWKWVGFVAHNVVVEKGPQKFKSKVQTEGKFSRVIRKPGVYRIVCTLHPGMTMRLTAKPPVEPTTTTSAPPAT